MQVECRTQAALGLCGSSKQLISSSPPRLAHSLHSDMRIPSQQLVTKHCQLPPWQGAASGPPQHSGTAVISAAAWLQVATDPDYRFELAVHLGELDTALEIAQTSGSEAKWRQLGELSLAVGKLQVRRSCSGSSVG